MSGELKGEWKLLKIWECRRCKALIRDERRVFEHKCEIKENELTIGNKVIEEQKGIIDNQKITIEEQKGVIDNQKVAIEEQKGVINDQKATIEDRDMSLKRQNETIKNHKDTIENQKNTIDSQKVIIDGQDKLIKIKAEEDQNKIIEDQKRIIEGHGRAIESQKRSIDDRDMLIYDQKRTIESQKKIIRDKEIEERVVNKNISKIDDTNNGGIHAHVLEKGKTIKDSRDIGYREDTEIEIFEKGKGKDRIIIKNGRLTKKPDYIDIIGEYTSEGFVMKGIYKQSTISASDQL